MLPLISSLIPRPPAYSFWWPDLCGGLICLACRVRYTAMCGAVHLFRALITHALSTSLAHYANEYSKETIASILDL